MKLDKEKVQAEALQHLKDANGVGTLHVGTGIGKSKIVCDFINYYKDSLEKVLILVPLNILIDNWTDELNKWMTNEWSNYITITTVQTAYKWPTTHWSLVVYDEAHTMVTEEYSIIFENCRSTFKIGLTATTDVFKKDEKQALYDKHIPIIYEYLDGEKDGILNRTKFTIIEHELDLKHMYNIKLKATSFNVPEKTQYEKLTEYLEAGQKAMTQQGSTDFFKDASAWAWNQSGNADENAAARKYMWAIRKRKDFLLNLRSSREIARSLLITLLKEKKNKVLVFSESVEQAKKITGKYTVWGKQHKITNENLIKQFNDGEIRALGSCNSLTMGMNFSNVNKCILESYQGSEVKATQKIGRLHRLAIDQIADIYIILIKDTQSEKWFNNMSGELDLNDAKILKSEDIFNGKS